MEQQIKESMLKPICFALFIFALNCLLYSHTCPVAGTLIDFYAGLDPAKRHVATEYMVQATCFVRRLLMPLGA